MEKCHYATIFSSVIVSLIAFGKLKTNLTKNQLLFCLLFAY